MSCCRPGWPASKDDSRLLASANTAEQPIYLRRNRTRTTAPQPMVPFKRVSTFAEGLIIKGPTGLQICKTIVGIMRSRGMHVVIGFQKRPTVCLCLLHLARQNGLDDNGPQRSFHPRQLVFAGGCVAKPDERLYALCYTRRDAPRLNWIIGICCHEMETRGFSRTHTTKHQLEAGRYCPPSARNARICFRSHHVHASPTLVLPKGCI